MGAKSTVSITREDAKSLLKDLIDTASDRELSFALEGILEDRAMENFSIVESYEDDTFRPYYEGMYS